MRMKWGSTVLPRFAVVTGFADPVKADGIRSVSVSVMLCRCWKGWS